MVSIGREFPASMSSSANVPTVFIVLLMTVTFLSLIDHVFTLKIDDIDLQKVEAMYKEGNSLQYINKHAMFPQPEEVYSTFNIPKHDKVSSRQKRLSRVFFPSNSIFVLDNYINIQLQEPAHVFVPLTLEARVYLVMPNITFQSFNIIKRSLQDRLLLFEIAEKFFNNLGYDGKSCILRAICERSEFHIITDGIINEIITLFLEFTTASGDFAYADYEAAREHGRSIGNCQAKYSSCFISIFRWLD